jgi:peptidoglycan/LPS O-acetylase OafA/YrhL
MAERWRSNTCGMRFELEVSDQAPTLRAMSSQLAPRSAPRDNNFDVLRLTAAGLVLVSHSWALTGNTSPTFAGDTLGGIGVGIFFAISGFLVSASWDLDPRVHAYALKRFLRLWPALIVVVVLCAYALGPLVTIFPLDTYLSSTTRDYVTSNVVLETRYALPGVFTDQPSSAMNGSLWTLPLEVKAYAIVLALGVLRLIRRPAVLVALGAGLTWLLAAPAEKRPHTIAHWIGGPIQARLVLCFVGGALLYALRDRIRLDWRIALLAALVWMESSRISYVQASVAWAITLPYLVAFAAYETPRALRWLVKPGDLSYGLYLWAYPVQQMVLFTWGRDLAPGWLLAIAGTVAYGVAFCSWRFIEAPALRLKQSLPIRGAVRPAET